VEQPRQRRESLFLGIVEKAQAEGVVTSVARAGGRIAAFLAEDQAGITSPVEADAGAVLDRLVKPNVHVTPPPTGPGSTSPAAQPSTSAPKEQEHRAVLDDLIHGGKKPEPPTPTEATKDKP